MAKIKYSALVSDMRNKLNGSVMSANRYGSYVRNKVTPVNPDTTAQQRSRAAFGLLSSTWKSLANQIRQGFTDLANQYPFTDIFGDTKHLDGKAYFIKTNALLLQLDLPVVTVAQQPTQLTSLVGADITIETSAPNGPVVATVELEDPLQSDEHLVMYATPPLPPQINFVKNRMRLVGTVAEADGSFDFSALYGQRFGAVTVPGERVHVRFAVLNSKTGQRSVPISDVGTL